MTSEELYHMAIKRLVMLALADMATKAKQTETVAVVEDGEAHGEVLAL